ncbi:hypothetical protein [Pandoraea apista]|uniref:hypothetical protein n=1 Tax=Pandoraea apista TaxID=93218 RepID=UPI000F67225C|nr:hypothetical protein [Pandoraea apista]RRW91041.1 hypothetical protein EGJ54_21615 [Pandoraea apista]RRX00832.1 hypothetical protein EGJ56_18275 [Pandoraea apista]
MQQIYAVIKRSSKYYGQTKLGERFDVHIQPQGGSEYVVHGNANDYRLSDVNLFVVDDKGNELRIA